MPVPLRAPILPVGPRWDGNYQPLFIIAIDRPRVEKGIFVLSIAALTFISQCARRYEMNTTVFVVNSNFKAQKEANKILTLQLTDILKAPAKLRFQSGRNSRVPN